MNISILTNYYTKLQYIECNDKDCPFNRVCSTHCSAGDFRIEGGFKPLIVKNSNGFKCQSRFSDPYGGQDYHSGPSITNGLGLCLPADIQNEESNYEI